MPIVKKRRNAEEEDPAYEQEVSASEEDESCQEEEEVEEEEEEDDFESDEPSNDETELPSTSKTLKEHATEGKKKQPVKRKTVPVQEKKQVVAKKPRDGSNMSTTPTSNQPNQVRKIKKVVKKMKTTDKTEDKKGVNLSIEYNDKNVDYNLYNEAPEHIKNVKIKISSNIVMLSRMIEASGNTAQGLTYDYAALSFVRQSKNGKAYEFNLPLNLAPSIVKGITLLIKQNPKFFDKQFHTVETCDVE